MNFAQLIPLVLVACLITYIWIVAGPKDNSDDS